MAQVRLISNEEASPEARVFLGSVEKLFGRIANASRAMANSPLLAQALFGATVSVLRTEITGILEVRYKALAILKTSMLNACRY